MNKQFAHIIEDWYRQNMRDLPWRATRDPYIIWVSEIILQQTRVAQGLDYFYRFIKQFPEVKSLAEADDDVVLRLWQGLGYYSRARNMHKAAKQIMSGGGKFPDTYDGVRQLAGIGDYTTAAIMSIAYDKPYAVVDGNVYRVLARTQGIDTPIDSTQGKKLFSQLAQEMLDEHEPALYNQAIMDFGAIQCTPKGCYCSKCPLQLSCVAYCENKVEELPVKAHKIQPRNRYLVYINVREKEADAMLIHRRSKGDIWEGLYEIPLLEVESAVVQLSGPKSSWLSLMMKDGGELSLLKRGVKHQLTHQTLMSDFYELVVPFSLSDWMHRHEDIAKEMQMEIVRLSELEDYAMPKLLLHLLSSKD